MSSNINVQPIHERLCNILDAMNSLDELEDNRTFIYLLFNVLPEPYATLVLINADYSRKIYFVQKVAEISS